MNAIELFAKYAVPAESVDDFVNKYYKYDRLEGRNGAWCPDYADRIRKSHRETFAEEGIDWIGPYESITGQTVSFQGGGK